MVRSTEPATAGIRSQEKDDWTPASSGSARFAGESERALEEDEEEKRPREYGYGEGMVGSGSGSKEQRMPQGLSIAYSLFPSGLPRPGARRPRCAHT